MQEQNIVGSDQTLKNQMMPWLSFERWGSETRNCRQFEIHFRRFYLAGWRWTPILIVTVHRLPHHQRLDPQ